MRGIVIISIIDTSTCTGGRRGAAAVRPRAPCLALAFVCAVLVLALSVAPASAGLYHPQPPVASFGSLGGACAGGDLATGAGDLTSGSKEITSVATTCGVFEVGQEISGVGLSGTITAVGAGTLTISSAASASGAGVALATSSTFENYSDPEALAFDQTAKRLYVADDSSAKLFGFDLSTIGSYVPLGAPFPFSLPELPGPGHSVASAFPAVDDSGGSTRGNLYIATNPYTTNQGLIEGYDSSGAPLAGFPIVAPPPSPHFGGSPWVGLAVDPSGDIWGNDGDGILDEYSPAGILLNTITLLQLEGTGGGDAPLAFDSNGDLYFAGQDAVWKLPAPAYDDPTEFVTGVVTALAVDRATGDVYAGGENVRRYSSDGTLLEEFATGLGAIRGIAIDELTGTVYVSPRSPSAPARKVYVFDASVLPDLSIVAPSDLAATTVTLNGSVVPSGVALTGCRFEWVTETAYQATGFASLSSGGEKACSPTFGSISVSGQTSVSAAISGLSPGETYRYRLSAENVNGVNTTKGVPASFVLAQPGVETVGSPIRTATTTRLDARVDPHGIATEYRFQYIDEAAYEANLAASRPPFEGAIETPDRSAGAGGLIELVSQPLEDLVPGMTYHYRVVADNGAFGGPAFGEAVSLTTRASDAPLSHGRYPGPSGSDRAWEQVNAPDTSGNPVSAAAGISGDGDSAVYQVAGGTPLSEAGTLFNFFFAQRPVGEHPDSGWRTEAVYPPRAATAFSAWRPPTGDDDLASLLDLNTNFELGSGAAVWRIPLDGGAPTMLYEAAPKAYQGLYVFSDDGSRALLVLNGSVVDPEHHSPGGVKQLYDVSSGVPRMVSLLPGNAVPSCGVVSGDAGLFGLPGNWVSRSTHWVSADGSYAFFPSAGSGVCSATHLYMRDFAASETYRVDGPPLSGPDCSGVMIRSTPDAVYFWTQSRLAPEDGVITGGCESAQSTSTGGDVYRYDLVGHALKCLTCVVPGGVPADVVVGGKEGHGIAVAPDGSRVYFTTLTRLLPGAAETGTPAVYRVDVATGNLAYVAPLRPGETVGENPTGDQAQAGSAISPDGRFLVFGSSSPGLDALTGSDNGNTVQDYLYDDADRSLLCVSCPSDGGAPRGAVSQGIINNVEPGPNLTALSENGDFAFATPTSLVAGDQNTAKAGQDPGRGTDVYEWRDGRALLVSDGLTDWPNSLAAPKVATISPDGRDLFFTEAAQLTPDALDGYARLYDARIGGGINFPEPPKPCPLEVCQGASQGAPEEAEPGSTSFSGPGNLVSALPTVLAPKQKKTASQLRAVQLAQALRTCRKSKGNSGAKRKRCEATARKRYGTKSESKTAKQRGATADHSRRRIAR